MFLTGLMHRDELYEISMRWLHDDLHEGDLRTLTEIFLFESAVTAPIVQDFMYGFFVKVFGSRLSVERVTRKDVLRERIIDGIPYETPRIRELVGKYREQPEQFFMGMPVDAVVLYDQEGRPVVTSRIKRTMRVAEKASYRMADALKSRILELAEQAARRRAEQAGVPFNELISTEAQMRNDFVEAEQRVATGFRDGRVHLSRDVLTINDVIGFKIVGDEALQNRIEQMLLSEPGVTVVEREEHRGHYNATNVLLDIQLPPVGDIIAANEKRSWKEAIARGLRPEQVAAALPRYVESGARKVRTEVIFTTYPELIESEFGRSLHEERILRMRQKLPYSGQIARNARYLIQFMLAAAHSPKIEIDSLPIKMWGRYLPCTASNAIAQFYGINDHGVVEWLAPT